MSRAELQVDKPATQYFISQHITSQFVIKFNSSIIVSLKTVHFTSNLASH